MKPNSNTHLLTPSPLFLLQRYANHKQMLQLFKDAGISLKKKYYGPFYFRIIKPEIFVEF